MSEAGLIAGLAYVLIALATVAALACTLARSGMPLDRTLIWPLYIAVIPGWALVIVPWFFPDGPMRDMAATLLNPGAPLYLAALAVVVIVTSLAQWQRVGPRPAATELSSPRVVEGVGASLIVLTVLTLPAITVVPVFLTRQLGLPMLLDGR